MTNIPTDAELISFAVETGMRVRTGKGVVSFARAVLARWGTPAPVGAEPVARLEIGKTKGGVSLTHIAEPAAFQLPEGMYALYTTPQPVEREPLTADEQDGLYWRLHSLSKSLEGRGRIDEYDTPDAYRTILDAMNALRDKKGGQHGADNWAD